MHSKAERIGKGKIEWALFHRMEITSSSPTPNWSKSQFASLLFVGEPAESWIKPDVVDVCSVDEDAILDDVADSNPRMELDVAPLLLPQLPLDGVIPATKLVRKSPAITLAVAPTVAVVDVVPEAPTPATAATVAALNNSWSDSDPIIQFWLIINQLK